MSSRLIAIASFAYAIIGCGPDSNTPNPTPPNAAAAPPEAAAKAPPTTVVVAAGHDFVIARYPATALPRADATATVGAPCEGRLLALAVNEGDIITTDAPLGTVSCLDAGVLASRRDGLEKRIAALSKRRRELDGLRRDGLIEIQRLVDADQELLTLRGELLENQALIARSGLGRRTGAASNAPDTLELRAPRSGIVTHVATQPGALLDRIGTPILTLAEAKTDRIEANLPNPPSATATFVFVPLAGPAISARLVSIRGPDGDAPTPESALRAVFAIANDDATATQLTLMAGSRGHIEVREGSPRVGMVPADALQRRPMPRGTADIFCIFPADAATVCHPVVVLGARGANVLVTDASGVTPRVAAGLVILSEVPSHIAAEREATP